MKSEGVVCSNCKRRRGRPKKRPYGSKRGLAWCDVCDRQLTAPISKKTERQKSKNNIKNYQE